MKWLFLVAAVVVALVQAWRRRVRLGRQRSLMRLCMDLGLGFAVFDPFPEGTWIPFRLFGRGIRRGIENVVWDRRDADGSIRAFDFWYEEQSQDQVAPVTTRLSCAVVPLPFTCPRLEVVPRDALNGVIELVTGEDTDLELDTFNRRFRVRSDDRRFAVAFCDQRMMQAMLALPSRVAVAVNEDRMLLRAPLLPPAEVLLLLEAARALMGRVPPVVASLYPPRPTKGQHEDRWFQGRWSADPVGNDGAPDPLAAGPTSHPAVG